MAGAGLALLLLGTVAPGRASASPADDKRAEAKRIAAQREQLTQDAERLNEQAKQVQDQLDALAVTIADTDQRLGAQNQAADGIRHQAAQLAVNAYVHGDVSEGLGAALADDGATNLQLHRGYTPVALGGSADVLDQARAVQQDTATLAAQLDAQRTQQAKLQSTLAARRTAIDSKQKQLASTAVQVDADLGRMVAEEQAAAAAAADAAAAVREQARLADQARKADAERARVAAALGSTSAATVAAAPASRPAAAAVAPSAAATTRPTDATAAGTARPAATTAAKAPPTTRAPGKTTAAPRATPPPAAPAPTPAPVAIPPTSPAAAVAVGAALAELGKPYVFGAAGPDTFDCSGLMMWAWAKAGVSMPHYTVSQFRAFPQVPLDQLQPGDLIFFNISLGHVGMYIGNGSYVQAPHTGDVVKISALAGRPLVGAVRPG